MTNAVAAREQDWDTQDTDPVVSSWPGRSAGWHGGDTPLQAYPAEMLCRSRAELCEAEQPTPLRHKGKNLEDKPSFQCNSSSPPRCLGAAEGKGSRSPLTSIHLERGLGVTAVPGGLALVCTPLEWPTLTTQHISCLSPLQHF